MREKSMLNNYSSHLAGGFAGLSGALNGEGRHFAISDRRARAAMAQESVAGIEKSQLGNLRFAGAPPHRFAVSGSIVDPVAETVLRRDTVSLERHRLSREPLRSAGARSSIMRQGRDSARPESAPLRKPHWLRHLSWPIWSWQGIARLWMLWRQERQIKRTVAILSQFEDRILWDIGITDRSRIEEVVRDCRDG
jgi:uncharacterized protein YjiS (DUF1127 family)